MMDPFELPPDDPGSVFSQADRFLTTSKWFDRAGLGAHAALARLDGNWQGMAAKAGLSALRRHEAECKDGARRTSVVGDSLRLYGSTVAKASQVIDELRREAVAIDAEQGRLQAAEARRFIVVGPGYTPADNGQAALAERRAQLDKEHRQEAEAVAAAAQAAREALVDLLPGGSAESPASLPSNEELLAAEWGLDLASVRIIMELEAGLERRMHNADGKERAYLLMLILSKFEYSGWKWDNTIGGLGTYFTVPYLHEHFGWMPQELDLAGVFEYLGLTKDDYEHLRFAIHNQHVFSGYTASADAVLAGLKDADYGADKSESGEFQSL